MCLKVNNMNNGKNVGNVKYYFIYENKFRLIFIVFMLNFSGSCKVCMYNLILCFFVRF